MVAYTKPQHRRKEESEQLRGKRDKIKSIDLRFERRQVAFYCKLYLIVDYIFIATFLLYTYLFVNSWPKLAIAAIVL